MRFGQWQISYKIINETLAIYSLSQIWNIISRSLTNQLFISPRVKIYAAKCEKYVLCSCKLKSLTSCTLRFNKNKKNFSAYGKNSISLITIIILYFKSLNKVLKLSKNQLVTQNQYHLMFYTCSICPFWPYLSLIAFQFYRKIIFWKIYIISYLWI